MQRKRFNELERAKKAEILERLKAERDLSNEIINTLKMSATGGFDAKASLRKKTNGSTVCSIPIQFVLLRCLNPPSPPPNSRFTHTIGVPCRHRLVNLEKGFSLRTDSDDEKKCSELYNHY